MRQVAACLGDNYGNGLDDACEGVCNTDTDCNDEDPCTDNECDPEDPEANAFGCKYKPWYDVETECCNPQDGSIQPIDDGDACTDDVCDPGTGDVNHGPTTPTVSSNPLLTTPAGKLGMSIIKTVMAGAL